MKGNEILRSEFLENMKVLENRGKLEGTIDKAVRRLGLKLKSAQQRWQNLPNYLFQRTLEFFCTNPTKTALCTTVVQNLIGIQHCSVLQAELQAVVHCMQ